MHECKSQIKWETSSWPRTLQPMMHFLNSSSSQGQRSPLRRVSDVTSSNITDYLRLTAEYTFISGQTFLSPGPFCQLFEIIFSQTKNTVISFTEQAVRSCFLSWETLSDGVTCGVGHVYSSFCQVCRMFHVLSNASPSSRISCEIHFSSCTRRFTIRDLYYLLQPLISTSLEVSGDGLITGVQKFTSKRQRLIFTMHFVQTHEHIVIFTRIISQSLPHTHTVSQKVWSFIIII